MGLFDGTGADGEAGSTAELAQLTGWPVVLVVDARGQGASVAALLRGFANHRPEAADRRRDLQPGCQRTASCTARRGGDAASAGPRDTRGASRRPGIGAAVAPSRPGPGWRDRRGREGHRARRRTGRRLPRYRSAAGSGSALDTLPRSRDPRHPAARPSHRRSARRRLLLHLSGIARRMAASWRRSYLLLAARRRGARPRRRRGLSTGRLSRIVGRPDRRRRCLFRRPAPGCGRQKTDLRRMRRLHGPRRGADRRRWAQPPDGGAVAGGLQLYRTPLVARLSLRDACSPTDRSAALVRAFAATNSTMRQLPNRKAATGYGQLPTPPEPISACPGCGEARYSAPSSI